MVANENRKAVQEWLDENLPDQKRPISQSSIRDGLHCERLYMFRSRWGLRPKTGVYSKSASTGNLVHKLLKVGKDRVEEVRQEVFEEHAKLLERIKAGEDLTGDLTRKANDLNHIYQTALAVVTIFWERFPPKKYMETVCREEKKMAFAPQNTLPCVWIADWIVKDKRDGSVWIRDTKTTGESFNLLMTGFLYSLQARFYRMMASQEEWGSKIKGFIVDMVRIPTIKLCGKDEKMAAKLGCTPFEAYVQRVKDWYELEEAKSHETNVTMDSRAILFNEDVHNYEIIAALDDIIALQQQELVPELFRRDITTSHCKAYRRVCPFYELCRTDISAWPSLIEQFYEIRELETEGEKKGS